MQRIQRGPLWNVLVKSVSFHLERLHPSWFELVQLLIHSVEFIVDILVLCPFVLAFDASLLSFCCSADKWSHSIVCSLHNVDIMPWGYRISWRRAVPLRQLKRLAEECLLIPKIVLWPSEIIVLIQHPITVHLSVIDIRRYFFNLLYMSMR